jgi:hypothetical protein
MIKRRAEDLWAAAVPPTVFFDAATPPGSVAKKYFRAQERSYYRSPTMEPGNLPRAHLKFYFPQRTLSSRGRVKR